MTNVSASEGASGTSKSESTSTAENASSSGKTSANTEESTPEKSVSEEKSLADTEETSKKSTSKSEESSSSSSSSKAPSSSVGESAASYACNFVGNPYVWGGESLTNGCDCSGFVMAVYAHFGYDLPHSSSDLASVGVGVSYADAQPGDIICYSGHVAIYLGGGAIVHASNERDGIKISDDASYRTIVAVRRIV